MLNRLDIIVSENNLDLISGLLALKISFGWEEQLIDLTHTLFRIHCSQKYILDNLREEITALAPDCLFQETQIQETDWQSAWKEFFTPICCGDKFVILPPWLSDKIKEFPEKTPIIIEPKSAFGTGQHATTALCLEVLGDLLGKNRIKSGQIFLDLGTGTGILGIACCKSGLKGLGLDIDPIAIDNAKENSRRNKTEQNFSLAIGSIETAQAYSVFDLILANILANPLIKLAPDLVSKLHSKSCLILSGILSSQADQVESAYIKEGLSKANKIIKGEWCALVWA